MAGQLAQRRRRPLRTCGCSLTAASPRAMGKSEDSSWSLQAAGGGASVAINRHLAQRPSSGIGASEMHPSLGQTIERGEVCAGLTESLRLTSGS